MKIFFRDLMKSNKEKNNNDLVTNMSHMTKLKFSFIFLRIFYHMPIKGKLRLLEISTQIDINFTTFTTQFHNLTNK